MRLEVSFNGIAGTGAAVGIAGKKSIIADRREGSAGGLGLGLSGGELQVLALGAGFFNQLHFSAAELDLVITHAAVDVALEFSDAPLLVTSARIVVALEVKTGPEDAAKLLRHAQAESTLSNSVSAGFPVEVARSK
jgi:organic hydroperoxide reductase OsmC/OhrA